MEHALTCNNLKCRLELRDRAVVTSCSHIFCSECAQQLGATNHETSRRTVCPACGSQLASSEDIFVANIDPSEEYKSSVLSGLSPNIIMECAGRALSFWAYQTTQDICYQQHLYKTLTEKYSSLSIQLNQTVNEANSEISGLQQRLSNFAIEYEALRRRNGDLAKAYKEKNNRLLQTQGLYDRAKRKAEIGEIQRAASDAVDLTVDGSVPPQSTTTEAGPGGQDGMPRFGQNQGRFDIMGRSSILPRKNLHRPSQENRWSRAAPGRFVAMSYAARKVNCAQASSNYNAPVVSNTGRVRVSNHSFFNPSNNQGLPGSSTTSQGDNVVATALQAAGLSHHKAPPIGIGLTSGVKVSQPTGIPGLDASASGD